MDARDEDLGVGFCPASVWPPFGACQGRVCPHLPAASWAARVRFTVAVRTCRAAESPVAFVLSRSRVLWKEEKVCSSGQNP